MSELPLRSLPPVTTVLEQRVLADALRTRGRTPTLAAVRRALDEARETLRAGRPAGTEPVSLARRAAAILSIDAPQLRPVLNATGILLHTGLGRAPLAAEALEAIFRVARGYCNLELDLESGSRGRRSGPVSELLARLTGADAAAVVNNNAAATVLALKAMAAGREVVVSRGQLVEIGGSFRLPEIFEVSGASLREVGTTNKTRLSDYEQALGPQTGAILRVHASNYRIIGFTETVPIADLVMLGRKHQIPVVDDIGSGALAPGHPPHVRGEPTVREGVKAGADLVLFSGDKLLGGPQCGLLAGRLEAVRKVESDPLMRAVRVDKLTIAALEATLRLALDPDLAAQRIPLWAFLNADPVRLRERAEALAEAIAAEVPGLRTAAVRTDALLGGGSVPAEPLASWATALSPPLPGGLPVDELARRLRTGQPAVVGRIEAGSLRLDLRAVDPTTDDQLRAAVVAALEARSPL